MEFKISVLLNGADGVVGNSDVDPGKDISGERVGVEDIAVLFARTLGEQELGLAEESQGGDIVYGFESDVRFSIGVESDVEDKHA